MLFKQKKKKEFSKKKENPEDVELEMNRELC